MTKVSVYVNKERRIVLTRHELPFRMSDPWPHVKIYWHRYRGLVTDLSEACLLHPAMLDLTNVETLMDVEEVCLTRHEIAIPEGAPRSYAASWAFTNLDKLGG